MQDWQARERDWIASAVTSGWPLTNISAGGSGMSQMLRDYWPGVMRDFLTPDLLKGYKTISEAEQKEIARQTAKAVREYAGHRIDGNRGGQQSHDHQSQSDKAIG